LAIGHRTFQNKVNLLTQKDFHACQKYRQEVAKFI
jgi:hypothetical protein